MGDSKRGHSLQAGTLGSMPSSEQQLSSLVEDFFFNPDVSHQECVQQAKGLSKRELHQVTNLLKNRLATETASRNRLQSKLSHEQAEVVVLQTKISQSAEFHARILQSDENSEEELKNSIVDASEKLEDAAHAYEVLEGMRARAEEEQQVLATELAEAGEELRASVRQVCEKELPYLLNQIANHAQQKHKDIGT